MASSFLELSDFDEVLTPQESSGDRASCFFDVLQHGGTFLGLRSFLNHQPNPYLLAAEEMLIQFSRQRQIDDFMRDEAARLSNLGSPIPGVSLNGLNPTCHLILTAGEFEQQSQNIYLYRLLASIQDHLYVIRMVLTFEVKDENDVPQSKIENLFYKGINKSRTTRRLGV